MNVIDAKNIDRKRHLHLDRRVPHTTKNFQTKREPPPIFLPYIYWVGRIVGDASVDLIIIGIERNDERGRMKNNKKK